MILSGLAMTAVGLCHFSWQGKGDNFVTLSSGLYSH